jgi:hypothetical protein
MKNNFKHSNANNHVLICLSGILLVRTRSIFTIKTIAPMSLQPLRSLCEPIFDSLNLKFILLAVRIQAKQDNRKKQILIWNST